VRAETDASPCEVDQVHGSVAESIGAMPDFLRWGVSGVSLLAGAVLFTLARLDRADDGTAPAERRAEQVGRLSRMPLPGLAEFVRLTRGLGLVSLYESRAEVRVAAVESPPSLATDAATAG
jgi:hypothetical protein